MIPSMILDIVLNAEKKMSSKWELSSHSFEVADGKINKP